MLINVLEKDLTMVQLFIDYLKLFNHVAINIQVIAVMPDVVALGLYMSFLEYQYGVGVTADNHSYTIYYIPPTPDSPFYPVVLEHMRKHNKNIIIKEDTSFKVSTVIQRYIDGVSSALLLQILPF